MTKWRTTTWLIGPASVGALVLALAQGPAYPSGADRVRASAAKADGSTLNVFAVVTPGGTSRGRVEYSTAYTDHRSGKVTCGWVSGTKAVVGGYDNAGAGFTIAMSDGPDGFIIGLDRQPPRAPCDTTGFGLPGSLVISSGYIEITDR